MSREKQIEEIENAIGEYYGCDGRLYNSFAKYLYKQGYRKQSENATLEVVDKFRSVLMDKFIDLCRGNDFNKINLLLIGETIDQTFDDVVAKMKGGAE